MSREDWLAARATGLGGSDVAALTRGKLWDVYADKVGLAVAAPETDAMRRGHGLEAFLRREVAHRHPTWRITQRHAILQHPTEDWALANIDGLIRTEDGPAVLELKTSRQSWPDGVPEDYQAQVQWYLGITGAPRAVVAVMFGDFSQAEYTLEADRDLQGALLILGEAFWRMVAARTPPPLDGSAGARAWLLAQYPRATRAEYPEVPALGGEAAIYAAASQRIKALTADRDAAGVALRAGIGDGPGLTAGGYRVVWVRKTDRRVDLARLRADHPDLLAQYTTEKPGDGGLRVTAPKEEDD